MISWNMHGRRVLRLAVPALSLFFTVPGLAQKLDLVPPGFEEQQIRSEADYVRHGQKRMVGMIPGSQFTRI